MKRVINVPGEMIISEGRQEWRAKNKKWYVLQAKIMKRKNYIGILWSAVRKDGSREFTIITKRRKRS